MSEGVKGNGYEKERKSGRITRKRIQTREMNERVERKEYERERKVEAKGK